MYDISVTAVADWRINMTGKVKFFNDEKGYGFIISDENKEEYFVHYSQILMEGHKTLKNGQIVEFEPIVDENTNKLKAFNVK